MKFFIGLGALFAGIGVVLGAFGAHSLKAVLDAKQLATFQTGVHYQFIHSLALVLIGVLGTTANPPLDEGEKLKTPGKFFIAGILLFSGSLYSLALGGPRFMGPVTPLGGLCFIIGWFTLAYRFLRK